MIGSVLSKHSKIKKITFTGSTRVGKLLMKMPLQLLRIFPWSWEVMRLL